MIMKSYSLFIARILLPNSSRGVNWLRKSEQRETAVIVVIMLNKNTQGAKKARPSRKHQSLIHTCD